MQVETGEQTHVTSGQMGQRILRATGALMIVQVILRGFGFIEKLILSRLFGTGWQADAYNAAKDIAFFVFQLVDQVVMHSFLPVFVQQMRERGERDAWRLASTAINLLILMMAGIAVVGIGFTHQILPVFVQGWFSEGSHLNADLIPLTETITRVMLVAVIFLASSSLTYCLLNSYKKFALPASADLALKATVLVFAVLFAHIWGPIALAVGFVFGAVAKLAVHGFGLGKRALHYRPVIDLKTPGLKQFGLLAYPLLIGVGVSIVRQVMDMRFTSELSEGSLSALKYARVLCDMPVQFFPYAFGIALFPFLADVAVAGDTKRLREMLMSATRMMILIFVPLAITYIMLRYPIILGLYGSKNFGMESANLTVGPLQVYAIAMLIGALEIIVLQFFFAMADTMRPAIMGIVMVPLHITIAYLGTTKWELQAMGIALAFLISKGAKIIVLYAMIRKKVESLEGMHTLAMVGKMLIALLPMAAILWLAASFLPEPGNAHGKVKKLLSLLPYVIAFGAAMTTYLSLLAQLKVDEVTVLLDRVRGKLLKKTAAV